MHVPIESIVSVSIQKPALHCVKFKAGLWFRRGSCVPFALCIILAVR